MRFCGGQNVPLCESLAVSRRTSASRVLWCWHPRWGAVEQAAVFGRLVRLVGRQLRRAARVGGGAREKCMVAYGAGRN
jgi:hypothetical protein